MERITFHRYGDPAEVLTCVDEPSSSPGDGDILVTVPVRPIHSGDLLLVNGAHDVDGHPVPPGGLTAGCEGLGIVEAVGAGVDPSRGLVPGARVCFCYIGTWREQLVLPADTAVLVPPGVEDDLAAQLSINPITALLLARETVAIAGERRTQRLSVAAAEEIIVDVPGEQGDVVVLSAAGSIPAKLLAAMVREKGITPIGTVRSRAGAEALRASTGIEVVATEDPDWLDQVRAAAGGANVVVALDAVGGEIGTAMLDLLSPGGTLLSYGNLSGAPLVVEQPHLWMEAKKVRGLGMIHWTLLPHETRAADVAEAAEFVQRHRHLLTIAGEFPLSQITDGVRLHAKPGRDGVVLLRSVTVARSGASGNGSGGRASR